MCWWLLVGDLPILGFTLCLPGVVCVWCGIVISVLGGTVVGLVYGLFVFRFVRFVVLVSCSRDFCFGWLLCVSGSVSRVVLVIWC